VAVDLDLGDLDVRAVGMSYQLLRGFATRLNNLFSIASQENLPDRLLIVRRLCIGEVPR